MSGSWGCPHELNDLCSKVNNLPCDPGMKGCVLYGRFVFANEEKNEPLRRKRARTEGSAASLDTRGSHDAEE
jgi:orotidine-5'-phosphate decarboxylase